jgi:hypothetical protein
MGDGEMGRWRDGENCSFYILHLSFEEERYTDDNQLQM